MCPTFCLLAGFSQLAAPAVDQKMGELTWLLFTQNAPKTVFAFLQANNENDELSHDGLPPWEQRVNLQAKEASLKVGLETASGGPCYSWESAKDLLI